MGKKIKSHSKRKAAYEPTWSGAERISPVGAGLLAMDDNDDARCLNDPRCPNVFREHARSYRYNLALAFDLALPAPFPEAERRRCAVGIPAWMPG
jgi:hypothetical protein